MAYINGEYEIHEDFMVKVVEATPDEDSFDYDKERRHIVDIDCSMGFDRITVDELEEFGKKIVETAKKIREEFSEYGVKK